MRAKLPSKPSARWNPAFEEEQMLDNLYLLLAGMMLEAQTKGEFHPFTSARQHFIECMARSERLEHVLPAVA